MNNDWAMNVLESREKRIQDVLNFLDEYIVVIVKANIVGVNKNIGLAFWLVGYFERLIDKSYDCNIKGKKKINSADGPYIRYLFDKKVTNLKEQMVILENSIDVGRLIDIDIYISPQSLNRKIRRKCLVCNKEAVICIVSQHHTYTEVISKSYEIAYRHFEKILEKILRESMEQELELDPKFGCVTKISNGSHEDMDYLLMKKAIEEIIPYMMLIFEAGFRTQENEIFLKIKSLGLACEKAMMKATNYTNCYKGLIFSLGLFCASVGWSLKAQEGSEKIAEDIFLKAKFLAQEAFGSHDEIDNKKTFGAMVYHEYNFGGLRSEALGGYQTVQNAYQLLNKRKELIEVLKTIILECEDTVLLKRSGGFAQYDYYKEFLRNSSNNQEVTEVFIQNNLSCGGSADLLVCALFMKLLNDQIKIEG